MFFETHVQCWAHQIKLRILFPPNLYTNISQFEQLKNKNKISLVTNISEKNGENRILSSIWWAYCNYGNYWLQKKIWFLGKLFTQIWSYVFALARFIHLELRFYIMKSNQTSCLFIFVADISFFLFSFLRNIFWWKSMSNFIIQILS